MKTKHYLVPSLLVCTVLALAARQFVKPAAAKPTPDRASYDAIDAYVEEQLHRLNIPGASLAVVEGDQIVHLRGFGRAYPDGDAPTAQTPFRIGSLTKSFTALGVMQLVEAGKIELDAPVQRYLPWFRMADPDASAEITVRHLLNQTSGLNAASGWTPLADFDASPDATERQARELAALELSHPVGTDFEYTNANYNLLGLIIEAASGESYADYVQAHIFDPLGMENSAAAQAAAPANLAMGHRFWFWRPVPAPDLPTPLGSMPSGQLISTSEDMGRYMIALLNEGRSENGQLISPASIAELHRGAAKDIEMGIEVGKYGMGWYMSEAAGTTIAWHHGMVPDFSACMALVPGQKRGVVLLMNVDHFLMSPILAETASGMGTILAGGEPEPTQFGMFPWLMRSLPLIPLLQVIGVGVTLRSLRRWRKEPLSRPTGARKWGLNITLPLVLNGLVALLLIPLLAPTGGFVRLFLPDYSLIAMISGGFAGVWGLVRTGLVVRELRGD